MSVSIQIESKYYNEFREYINQEIKNKLDIDNVMNNSITTNNKEDKSTTIIFDKSLDYSIYVLMFDVYIKRYLKNKSDKFKFNVVSYSKEKDLYDEFYNTKNLEDNFNQIIYLKVNIGGIAYNED